MTPEPTRTEAPESLTERLSAELARRWQLGERPLAEEYLDRHPELWTDPAAAAAAWEKVLEVAPGFPLAWRYLGLSRLARMPSSR